MLLIALFLTLTIADSLETIRRQNEFGKTAQVQIQVQTQVAAWRERAACTFVGVVRVGLRFCACVVDGSA